VRHGARTPVVGVCPKSNAVWACEFTSNERPNFAPGMSLYAKTWINGRNFYPGTCGMGVLTSLGYQQQIRNGVFLRSRYNSTFLPDRINQNTFESKFYVRSTDVPRVILSAESVLSGLYPPDKRDGTFAIKINTMDQYNENLVANAHVCPKIAYYVSEFKASALYKNHTTMVTIPLVKKIASALNMKPEELDLPAMFDCWISDICHGHPIPSGITEDLLQQAMKEGEWQYGQSYYFPTRVDYCKPGIGTFMHEYLSVFQNIRNNPNNPLQFVMYAAHDTTIMPVLVALNAWNNIWPTFAAHIISEYYEAPNPSVRILYNGKPLILPECGQEFCPYETFESIVNKIIPTSFDCQINPNVQQREIYRMNSFN